MDCPWCREQVLDGDTYPEDAYGPPGTTYHQCWVRLIVGSVGRQLDLRLRSGVGDGDPPGYTRREAAAAAAKLAVDLDAVPGPMRPAALADARKKVQLLGADVLFAWSPGVAIN